MDRRSFLQQLAAGVASASLPGSIVRALEIPANRRTGTIEDVEHVIFLMQENRSFDHYFGMLRGVRGFNDPRAVRLRWGDPVWKQPDANGPVLPFHPPAPKSSDTGLGLTFLEDLAHDWTTTHQAWNRGEYDQWIAAKGPVTMAYLTREDIPFHYALADAFTVCDAYYCSLLGPTSPNRYHMWTGWVGNDGRGGGPKVDNDGSGFHWGTYPERLHKAGITCKVYQDTGTGLGAAANWGESRNAYIGNYGDNGLLYFRSYEQAHAGSPLAEIAKTGTAAGQNGDSLFEIFAADVRTNRLPRVSWIVPPEAYSEHPNWPANYGAWYVSQILDALTANPEVWSKTALFLMYDENDGFFDHMVPPTPPGDPRHGAIRGLSTVSTDHEIFHGDDKHPPGPYGLGVRVPMIVISPWSRGGWVNSEVFDHTSMIRFLEKRFGVHEPNITRWRRTVTGDLTSAFDFSKQDGSVSMSLPSTAAFRPPDETRHSDYQTGPPADQALPQQESGTRPARPLPYALEVDTWVDGRKRTVALTMHNSGSAGAVLHVRTSNGAGAPRDYTVGAGRSLADTLTGRARLYDYAIHGPNGFYRGVSGGFHNDDLVVTGRCGRRWSADGQPIAVIRLTLQNPAKTRREITIYDRYKDETHRLTLEPGAMSGRSWTLEESHGWYELHVKTQDDGAYRRYFAGHVETGRESISDPAMGRA